MTKAVSGRPGGAPRRESERLDRRVVADTWWRGQTALDALPIVWEKAPAPTQSSATIAARLKEG